MMTKKIVHLLLLIALFSFAACDDIDNYEEPKETLQGKLIDESTGNPLITEQPNGFRIKLAEISWSDTPQNEHFAGKADGTFFNKRIFKGTYEVTPVEGAFFPVEKKTVEINGVTTVDFSVIPYLSISKPEIKKIDGTSVEVTYTLSRMKEGDKILDTRVFVSTNPNVGNNIFTSNLSPIINLKEINDTEVLQTTFKQVVTGLESGKTYYLRVGARTDNPQKRYNFTQTIELK
ncbi:DUF3823 domain-containing protein [Dysgonomonas sp. Marseille-P4677]|uniref:DUF3823 domain-containing protein n=1 Tax=Dysgonomonas sp. Marseille-P4677 TaxID=2364790 RepID=UPI0019142295|nr:DUF3823 domain-containing protein [Dysgonomonas sp. Marseille-P4677]MBK5723019.1 DUF3823 domain-containing protein [Dysgonomonas sp. Marseille-P4677]